MKEAIYENKTRNENDCVKKQLKDCIVPIKSVEKCQVLSSLVRDRERTISLTIASTGSEASWSFPKLAEAVFGLLSAAFPGLQQGAGSDLAPHPPEMLVG